MARQGSLPNSRILLLTAIFAIATVGGIILMYATPQSTAGIAPQAATNHVVVVPGASIRPAKIHPTVKTEESPPISVQIDGDAIAIVEAYTNEPVNSGWAQVAREKLMHSLKWPIGITIQDINCKSTTCSINGTIDIERSSGVDSTISAIEGDIANAQLNAIGFVGQRSAVYTVLPGSPPSMSFIRIVQRSGS